MQPILQRIITGWFIK